MPRQAVAGAARRTFWIALLLLWATICQAQSVARILPEELAMIPSRDIADDPYWQQLVVTLGGYLAAGEAAIAVDLPEGLFIPDTNGDGRVSDEVRVLYKAVAGESPGLFVSQQSTPDNIVVGSAVNAAEGGEVYLQFPVLTRPTSESLLEHVALGFSDSLPFSYGSIALAGVDTLVPGPGILIVGTKQFELQGSMNLIVMTEVLAAGADTATAVLGTHFPEQPTQLVQKLPDLVFDNGGSQASNLLGFSDGNDGNDVSYSFYWSTDGGLTRVDAGTAQRAVLGSGGVYGESEGPAAPVRLLTRDLAEGTYYLYVVSNVTGGMPLGRSRGLRVVHVPVIEHLGPDAAITLDSGGLHDSTDAATGRGVSRLRIEFAVIDHDDDTTMHLFYSDNPNLAADNIVVNGNNEVASLEGALSITPTGGVPEADGAATWHILAGGLVSAGTYYVYGVAEDGRNQSLRRSASPVRVRHSPFLRLDAIVDDLLAAPDTVFTGGVRPQRHLSITWGRAGIDGDGDWDGNAAISLYYSTLPATASAGSDSLPVPGGGSRLLSELDSLAGRVVRIGAGIAEDPDARADNQMIWDLWSLEDGTVPAAGQVHYLYGLAEDDSSAWLAQVNGGRINDMNSQVVFAHPPFIRALQPAADVTVTAGIATAATWEDMDLDDDAAIRVLLTSDSLGTVTSYGALSGTAAFVVNSADGRAAPEVDPDFDLSEDADVDTYDIGFGHLQRSLIQDQAPADGEYYVYLAITEGERFDDGALAWQAPGKIILTAGEVGDAGSFRVFPEVFSIGVGGLTQLFELRVDAGGEEVDLLQVSLELDGEALAVVDQDPDADGIQPFAVAPGFAANQLFVNEVQVVGDDLELHLDYFDPSRISGLDGDAALATFEVRTLAAPGPTEFELLGDPAEGRFSHLQYRGAVVVTPTAGTVATGALVTGRTLSGRVLLEGRTDMSAAVDFSLREWSSYAPVVDSAFAVDNDVDPERSGVQVLLDSDGSFSLVNAPAGQLDLFVHLDGYLDAWVPGLVVTATADLVDLLPSSSGAPGDSLMLAGDVAGYTDVDGQTQPDNEVTLADWDYLASMFGRTIASDHDSVRADINGDGEVSLPDLALLTANFRSHGPRPVYKPAQGLPMQEEAPVLRGAGPVVEALAVGDVVELQVQGSGLEGVRAIDLAVDFDPGDWTCDRTEYPVKRTGTVLTADKIERGSCRSALSRVGRAEGFGASGPLVTWRLRARDEHPEPPRLRSVLLLDHRHGEVSAAVSGRFFGMAAPARPGTHALGQNYPNPFNPETAIPFVVGAGDGSDGGPTPVRLEIFDALGRSVVVLRDQGLAPGHFTARWNGLDAAGRPAASGIYAYRLRVGSAVRVKRMLLVR